MLVSTRDKTFLKHGRALALLIFVGAGAGNVLLGQASGAFTSTGSMTVARVAHSATLLTNGKVLIAGGANFYNGGGETVWAPAELYDPATGTFSATGNMTTARWQHTATLLPDGRVLIAGGSADGASVLRSHASAEIYDPLSGTFSATGSMSTRRAMHSATLLADGRVLIAGGLERYLGLFKASAELYDPSTGAFAAVGDMSTTRFSHTATLLPSGKVLIDGSNLYGDFVNYAELYDPDTKTFTFAGRTPYSWMGPVTANLLMNGEVLVTREYDLGSVAERYDPSAGSWSAVGPLGNRYRNQHTGTLLTDGTVLIAGGDYLVGEALRYDPAVEEFSSAGDMGNWLRMHSSTLLPDGSVLIAGGYDSPPVGLSSAQLYSPSLRTLAPRLLSLPSEGRVQGAILHAGTARPASSNDPVAAGEVLEIYLNGLIQGSVIPPQVAIGGRMAEMLFFGKAPGFAELHQVNVRVPKDVASGPAVPVRLTYLGRPSNEVTIGLR